jgi:gliding motility-associated-like protein
MDNKHKLIPPHLKSNPFHMRLFTPFVLFVWGLFFFCATDMVAQDTSADPSAFQVDGSRPHRQVIIPQTDHQNITLKNLEPNQTYSLIAPPDGLATGNCTPDIIALDAGVQVLGYNTVAHQLRFVALAKEMHFSLVYNCSWDPSNPPANYVSINCESCTKKKLKDVIKDLAVIDVAPSGSADDLVRNVLIGGDCFDITGVVFEGQGGQVGTFSNGLTNVGFSTGVIMATGDITVAIGPNDSDNASAGYGIGTPDADLSTLTGGSLFDRANIEFDFTPTQSPVTFSFVFASEEYCEYVNTQFNDVFGFFISGPGIAGTQNIALIPATNIPVAINNVNHLTNSGFYKNNTPAGGILCGQNPSVLPATQELQFDGFTTKFVAAAAVTPCQTYHIKLKIADVGDGIYDSAVFLQSGSFDAGGNASVEWIVNGDPDNKDVYEGCGTVQLHFHRVGTNPNVPMTVQYTVTGTATSGLDYSPIPGVVVIPAGQTDLYINVNIVNDNLVEGVETVIITLNNPCSCLHPQEILHIHDLPALSAIPDTVSICGPGVGTVGVEPVGGVEPLTYHWNTGATTQTITQFVQGTTNYKVTVTDACGKTFVATARVIVTPPPLAQMFGPPPQLCPGQTAILVVHFTGAGPYTLDYTLNGDPQPSITDITSNPYNLVISQTGLYHLVQVTDGLGCVGSAQGSLLVQPSSLAMTGTTANVTCSGGSNGSITTVTTGGSGPFTYTWTGPSSIGNTPNATNIKAGAYTVTLSDASGCTVVQNYTVNQPTALLPTVANAQGPNCTNPAGGSINLNVSGGTPVYAFHWSNGSNSQNPQGLNAGTYTVTVTDQVGCTKTTSASIVGDFTPPTAVANVNGSITCAIPAISLDGTGSSTGPNFSYNWTANPGTISSGGNTLTPTVSAAGTYTLVVTNANNGCTAGQPVLVTANNILPNANAGPNATLTCTLTNTTLDGTGSSTGANYTYNWTASGGGTITGGATSLNPNVSTPGTYTLVVTNNANGCTKSDDAVVNNNVATPNAVVANPPLLTCTNNTVPLNGSGSTPAGNITYQWSTANGNIVSGQTSANAFAGEPGLYTLVVTNSQNGCTNSQSVTVNQDNSLPVADAAAPSGLDCNTTQVTINGAGSSTGAGYTFAWTSTPGGNFVSGQNTLTPVVNAAGTYTLLVTNTLNNCSASATVLISQDNIHPTATTGPPGTLTCTTTSLMLGDSNALTGPNLSYTWTGTGITGGANTPNPTVDQPGTYNLVVKNSTNGCSTTASVVVSQNITHPTAVAGPGGQLNCTSPTIQLNGAGSSTGASYSYNWTSSTGGGLGSGANTLTPTVTAAGTYTLLVTNSVNGCTSTATSTVTTNANLPNAIAVPGGIVTCAVPSITIDATGSSTGPNFTYQWGTVNGQITGGQGTLQATVAAPGQYTLVVTNTTNNCTTSFSVDVNADIAPPVASAGPAKTLDCTAPSLTLNGSGSSNGANFAYQWTALTGGNFTSPTNIINPQVNAPGTYQILVTDTQNGCTSVSSVIISADANQPVPAIAAPAILNCNTLQVIIDGSGSTTGPNISYTWVGLGLVSGSNSPNPVVNQPGNYTLTISNSSNGCTSSKTVAVVQDIVHPPADAGADNLLNCYTPQLQLGSTNNPSGPNFTFLWTGTGIVSGATTPTPVIDQGGTFDLVVTNTTNGCSSTDQVLISTDFATPQGNAGAGFQLTCVQNTYTLAATASQGPSFTYNWTTNTGNFTTPTNILNPTVNGAGFYYLLVTNTSNGCTTTSSVQITQSPDVPVALAGTPGLLTCAVTSLNLTGTGSSTGANYTYLWSTSDGNIVSGGTTLSPSVDQPGLYSLVVTNTTNSCTSTSSIQVNQDIAPPLILPGPVPTLTCASPSGALGPIIGTGGTFTYQWQSQNGGNIVSGSTTLTPTVNAAGSYLVTVTSQQNGCTNTSQVDVLANQIHPNALIAAPDTLTCAVLKITLDASASTSGNMAYNWTATNGGHISSLANPIQPEVDKPGTYTIVVTDNGNGCTQSFAVNVAQDVQHPVADAGQTGEINCIVSSYKLDGTASSKNGNYFYQWTTTDGAILVGANSLTPTVIGGGTYLLTVINNTNGCSSIASVKVLIDTVAPTIAIASPPIITCTQSQVTINGSGSQTGVGVTYFWTTNDGNIVSGQNANSVVVDQPGTYLLKVYNGGNGCTSTKAAVVSDNIVLPVAVAGPSFTLTCSQLKGSLHGTASTGSIYTYKWTTTTGNIVSGGNTLTPVVDQEGTYQLVVTNTNTGCSKTDAVIVYRETNVPTDFEINLKKPTCKDNDGDITFGTVTGGYGPYLYSIDGGKTFVTALDFAAIHPGAYDLWIQDVNGCEFHKALTVPKAPDPVITIDPKFSIELGDSVQLKAVLPLGYPLALVDTILWTPLDGLHFKDYKLADLLTPYAKPFKPTEYVITLISKDGCQATDRVLINVNTEPHIFIPNAFSPWNGDGKNDVAYIFAEGIQVIKINNFQIFDRWGEMVFQATNFQPNDPKHGWDGRVNGKLLDPAVFVYYAEILLIDGRTVLYKGDITLVR